MKMKKATQGAKKGKEKKRGNLLTLTITVTFEAHLLNQIVTSEIDAMLFGEIPIFLALCPAGSLAPAS